MQRFTDLRRMAYAPRADTGDSACKSWCYWYSRMLNQQGNLSMSGTFLIRLLLYASPIQVASRAGLFALGLTSNGSTWLMILLRRFSNRWETGGNPERMDSYGSWSLSWLISQPQPWLIRVTVYIRQSHKMTLIASSATSWDPSRGSPWVPTLKAVSYLKHQHRVSREWWRKKGGGGYPWTIW